MAAETNLAAADLDEGFAVLQRFWAEGRLGVRT
jgi:hypothetical protein